MIGAINITLSETCTARLYLVGTYEMIDWDVESPTNLSDYISICRYKDDSDKQPSMVIAQSLNDEYCLRLIETKRYIIKLEDKDVSVNDLPHIQNENNKFLKCDKDSNSVIFQFVNYLGKTKMVFKKYGIILPFEVVPNKMNYEDDYIRLTEALADVCSELLLEHSGSTSNVFSRSSTDKKTLLEQFIFLRKFCYEDNVQGIFESIKRNPDRVLDQEEELKPWGTGNPSKKFYRNPFSYSRGWLHIPPNAFHDVYYAPRLVSVTRKYERLDTPANRFVKFALIKFDSICQELIDMIGDDNENKQSECVEEAKSIHNAIEVIFRDHFFDDIGELEIIPQNNQVLQKRNGYSQIFAAYSMIDLALQLNWKGKDEIYEGESKNIALLYEYWLFFELYRIISSIEGCVSISVSETPFISNDNGLTISLNEGHQSCQSFVLTKHGVKINLYYNRPFPNMKFNSTQYEGSYSMRFRPDYTLAIFPTSFVKGEYNGEEEAISYGAVSYMHFDAKYRITDLTNIIGNPKAEDYIEDELLEDKLNSIVNTYKRGDLLKMHTYNDAIRRTLGSYVLYPGEYTEGSTGNETFSLYDEILPGVGAFSIKPSLGVQGENELKRFILSSIESGSAKNSRLNRLKYYTEMILSEPSVHSNSIVRSSSTDSTFVLGYIRNESEKDYYRFLSANDLLKVGSVFPFYFYAIKGTNVYSHHKDIFKIKRFRFYTNDAKVTNKYILEPVSCQIVSNKLISRRELVEKLLTIGFKTDEESHYADFYYILEVEVVDNDCSYNELSLASVNSQNGNDTFSSHSPKVVSL